MNVMNSALEPYRVLDMADQKGWLCGRLLGDLGADVIKIEPPSGDPGRRVGPFYRNIPDPEKSLWWFAYNANKSGVTLNIETVAGKEAFKRLVKSAHFVIESYTPGYMEELGLGYEALSEMNPGIIMTSITPFGQTGPKARYAATDLTCWASGGQMFCTGDSDRAPVQITFPHAYSHGSCEAAIGCLIAHYHREVTGEGQHVDVSIQESVIGTLMDTQERWLMYAYNVPRMGVGLLAVRPDGIVVRQRLCFQCKDGCTVCYTIGGGMRAAVEHLQELTKWMREEGMAPEWMESFDWLHDYQTVALTQEKIDEVEGIIADFLITKTKKELYDETLKRRLLIAPVKDAKNIYEDDQLQFRGYWEEVYHPELNQAVTYCGPFVKLSETLLRIRRRAPLIGEHNEEIYEKELGLSKEEITIITGSKG